MKTFQPKKKQCEVVFIEENIILIGKKKYHRHGHEFQEIIILLKKILVKIEPPDIIKSPAGYISSLAIYENNDLITSIKGKLNIMAIQLKDSQVGVYTLAFVDRKGKPADAASVDLSIDPAAQGTISYDDPTNTVTITAGDPGVATIKTVPKDSKGNILPFADEALEILAGDAVGGSRSDVTVTEQP